MTMLFRLDAGAPEIAATFAARQGEDPWSGGHVAPGSFAPIVTSGREFVAGPRPNEALPRRLVPRVWGVPPPASAGDPARGVFTVRNPDSPFWTGNLRNSEFRCLVPATAIMEWGKGIDARGKRVQCWFSCADQPLFAMAGVWKDSEVPSFALLTCAANAMLRSRGIERMPAILPPDAKAQSLWLNGDWPRAATLIAPYSSTLMQELSGRQ